MQKESSWKARASLAGRLLDFLVAPADLKKATRVSSRLLCVGKMGAFLPTILMTGRWPMPKPWSGSSVGRSANG